MTIYKNKEEKTLKQIQNSMEELNDIQNSIYELDNLDTLSNDEAREVEIMMFHKEKEALEKIRNIINKANIYEKYEKKTLNKWISTIQILMIQMKSSFKTGNITQLLMIFKQ